MDIHKPKAAHSWREFLIEIGTIICGILIALGLEQVVEWAHWQERLHETREGLRRELHEAVVAADGRLQLETCDADMLNRVEAALVVSGSDWQAPVVMHSPLGRGVAEAPKALWAGQAWRNAQADGSANHLAKDEALAFGGVYESLSKIRALNDQEASDLSELNSLAVVRRLDEATRTQYLRLLYRARLAQYGTNYYSRNLLKDATKLGVEPPRPGEYGPALNRYLDKCRQLAAGASDIGG